MLTQQTNFEQAESSNTHTNAEKTPKLEYFNEEIKGAKPLRVVGNDEQGYCIVFGKYRLGEIKKTKKEAEDQIYEEPWQITINLIAAILTNVNEPKTQDKIKTPE